MKRHTSEPLWHIVCLTGSHTLFKLSQAYQISESTMWTLYIKGLRFFFYHSSIKHCSMELLLSAVGSQTVQSHKHKSRTMFPCCIIYMTSEYHINKTEIMTITHHHQLSFLLSIYGILSIPARIWKNMTRISTVISHNRLIHKVSDHHHREWQRLFELPMGDVEDPCIIILLKVLSKYLYKNSVH